MDKKLRIFVIAFLTISCLFFKFNGLAKAESPDLEIFTIPPKPPIYVGDSFILEARITNQNTTISHSYKLVWTIDDYSRFTSQGTIEPNETINITPSFTFSTEGEHKISVELFEDENQTAVAERNLSITVVKVGSSLGYAFDPYPIYPNSSFSLTLAVTNEGSETIYDASVRVIPFRPEVRIEALYGLFSKLNNITAGGSNGTMVPFIVHIDANPGIYPLKVHVEFYDAQGYLHQKNHYVPIQISSGYARDKVDILEPQFKLLEKDLDSIGDTMLLNMTYIAIILIAVNAVTASLNYWYARKLARRARARAKGLKK